MIRAGHRRGRGRGRLRHRAYQFHQFPHPGGLSGGPWRRCDAFVTKLTPAGNALVYSTYLGGSNIDYGIAIAVDGAGAAYVTGETNSTNFPTQQAYQGAMAGGMRCLRHQADPRRQHPGLLHLPGGKYG